MVVVVKIYLGRWSSLGYISGRGMSKVVAYDDWPTKPATGETL